MKKIGIAGVSAHPIITKVRNLVSDMGHVVVAPSNNVDVPWGDVGAVLGQSISSGDIDLGIGFCWTGHGVAISANRFNGVRAAYCTDITSAKQARSWHDTNLLALSFEPVILESADEIIAAWLDEEIARDSYQQTCLNEFRSTDIEGNTCRKTPLLQRVNSHLG